MLSKHTIFVTLFNLPSPFKIYFSMKKVNLRGRLYISIKIEVLTPPRKGASLVTTLAIKGVNTFKTWQLEGVQPPPKIVSTALYPLTKTVNFPQYPPYQVKMFCLPFFFFFEISKVSPCWRRSLGFNCEIIQLPLNDFGAKSF